MEYKYYKNVNTFVIYLDWQFQESTLISFSSNLIVNNNSDSYLDILYTAFYQFIRKSYI